MTYSNSDRRIAHSLGVRLDDDPPAAALEEQFTKHSVAQSVPSAHQKCHEEWLNERCKREDAESRAVQAFRDADRLNTELRAERRWGRVCFLVATTTAAYLTVRMVIWIAGGI